MSVPGNINTAPPPSSFDKDEAFYEESRWAKLKRRLIEEPLIPIGCALTCWALLEATKSIKSGDKNKTNRMFRRRIYAQGFTIAAMLLGSAYWEGDRKKRNEFNELIEDKKKKDRHDAWLKELEVRQEEEDELKRLKEKVIQGKVAERQKFREQESRALEDQIKKDDGQPKGGLESVRSVLEASETRREGPILAAIREMWSRRSD